MGCSTTHLDSANGNDQSITIVEDVHRENETVVVRLQIKSSGVEFSDPPTLLVGRERLNGRISAVTDNHIDVTFVVDNRALTQAMVIMDNISFPIDYVSEQSLSMRIIHGPNQCSYRVVGFGIQDREEGSFLAVVYVPISTSAPTITKAAVVNDDEMFPLLGSAAIQDDRGALIRGELYFAVDALQSMKAADSILRVEQFRGRKNEWHELPEVDESSK